MEDLLKLDACRPPSNWRTNENLSGSVSPLQWEVWDHFLESYPDQRFRDYIVDGIRVGFRVGFNYSHTCQASKQNMASATQHPDIVREYLERAERRENQGPAQTGRLPSDPDQPLWGDPKEYSWQVETNSGLIRA